MIISRCHGFIFLKPLKVGGTSVQQTIGTSCCDGDAVSALFLEPEDLPRFAGSRLEPIPEHTDPAKPRATRYRINTGLTTHALPAEIRNEAGEATWEHSFKFTVVRNPWDLMVSFRKVALINPSGSRLPLAENFTDFVRGFAFEKLASPFDTHRVNDGWYFDPVGGHPIVDFFIRFEDLQHGFDRVCDHVSLPRKRLVHLQNKGSRPDYRELYTPETREIVASLFRRDIEFFGYEF
jgi:hypothetical protein